MIDVAVALYRAQQFERDQYLQEECAKQGYTCARIYLFPHLDGDILAFSASGAALAGAGLWSLVLNRGPATRRARIMVYLLGISLFGVYAAYYNTFSYAQYYWDGWFAPFIPIKSFLQ